MLPFSIDLKLSLPISEQVIFAVKKSVVIGQMKPGQVFPSVRVVSKELKINPNTAHRIVTTLVAQGVLITKPGIGSIIAKQTPGDRRDRAELLGSDLERVVVEAKKIGLTLKKVRESLTTQWRKLTKKQSDKIIGTYPFSHKPALNSHPSRTRYLPPQTA